MQENNNELFEKLSRLQWLFHKRHLRGRAEGGPVADPTRGQGRILAILKMQDGVSTKDLSYLLGIRVSSLNELIAKLEKGGYVTREPSEADKRVMLVKLTDKGRAERQPGVDSGDVFSCLSAEEQAAFGQYLNRLIDALETEFGGGSDEEYDWWMLKARERMGDDRFERFASMRRGRWPTDEGGDPRCGFDGRGGRPMDERGDRRCDIDDFHHGRHGGRPYFDGPHGYSHDSDEE